MDNFTVKEIHSEKHTELPNVNSLLKISFGLVLFTMLSFAFAYAETISVDVEGTSFDVEYNTVGMTVSGIEADVDFTSLILTVDVTESPGMLDIIFERSFFDSMFEGLDEDFIILADGDDVSTFSETATEQSRTLSIELPRGTEEVEIYGSDFGVSIPDIVLDVGGDDAAAEKAAADAAEKEAAEKAAADAAEKEAAEKAAADAAEKEAAEKAAADTTRTSPAQCGPGTVLQDGSCVLDERCGPGTVLQDGSCVLDERCGPGTVLQDGTCVPDSTPQPSNTSDISIKGLGKELVIGLVAAFVGAGIVGIVLAIMSKASKSS